MLNGKNSQPARSSNAELTALHEHFDEPDAAHRCMEKDLKPSVEPVCVT